MSLLNGRRTTDIELTIPPSGGWVATGHLESGAPLEAGAATLVLGDLTLAGAVLPGRGGTDSPDRPAFVVAGGAGWRTSLSISGSYASPSGVRLRTVLADLARAAGEILDAPPDASLGSAYGWDAGTPADAVLAELVARGALEAPWRVQPNGRTTFTPWPAIGAADARGQIVDRRLARGLREVALTTSVASWLPGGTVQGAMIRRVNFKESAEEIRALAWEA